MASLIQTAFVPVASGPARAKAAARPSVPTTVWPATRLPAKQGAAFRSIDREPSTGRAARHHGLKPAAAAEGEGGNGASIATESEVQPPAWAPLLDSLKEALATGPHDEATAAGVVDKASAELSALTARAAAAEARAATAEDGVTAAKSSYLRLTADFDNFRKRMTKEKEGAGDNARGDMLGDLLPLVDNFELASKAIKLETDGERKVHAQYQAFYKQMVETLRKMGLQVALCIYDLRSALYFFLAIYFFRREPIDVVGQQFDPAVMEAIMRETTEAAADGTVLEEFRRGFRYRERLLRPAMVKVASNDLVSAPAVEQVIEI